MRIYLFEGVTVSKRVHSRGSAMVIAQTDEEVLHLLSEFPHVQLAAEDWQRVRHFPTHNYIEPEVFIFPDVGCC